MLQEASVIPAVQTDVQLSVWLNLSGTIRAKWG